MLLRLCIREETSVDSWKIWIGDSEIGVGYVSWHLFLFETVILRSQFSGHEHISWQALHREKLLFSFSFCAIINLIMRN